MTPSSVPAFVPQQLRRGSSDPLVSPCLLSSLVKHCCILQQNRPVLTSAAGSTTSEFVAGKGAEGSLGKEFQIRSNYSSLSFRCYWSSAATFKQPSPVLLLSHRPPECFVFTLSSPSLVPRLQSCVYIKNRGHLGSTLFRYSRHCHLFVMFCRRK